MLTKYEMEKEIERLHTENARLAGDVESLKQKLDNETFCSQVDHMDNGLLKLDIQHYKEALEVARSTCELQPCFCIADDHPKCRRCQALAAIAKVLESK